MTENASLGLSKFKIFWGSVPQYFSSPYTNRNILLHVEICNNFQITI